MYQYLPLDAAELYIKCFYNYVVCSIKMSSSAMHACKTAKLLDPNLHRRKNRVKQESEAEML